MENGVYIVVSPNGNSNNLIFSNFIGIDQSGTLNRGNGTNMAGLWGGVYIGEGAHHNLVDGNLIAANG